MLQKIRFMKHYFYKIFYLKVTQQVKYNDKYYNGSQASAAEFFGAVSCN